MNVLIVCGSESDMDIAQKAGFILEGNQVDYDLEVASAHRDPRKVQSLVEKGYDVYIAVAGLSAALPGFIASLTDKPVIGVPVSAKVGGLDALLSIVQMPKGVPVACVGIDNAENAAYLALRILKLSTCREEEP
ncbi:MAG: AIR carboxylase family protein [Theionarchaea archaeon]|nr:AIR carboxylase family protein [Theionarchaea archaeon]MBU7001660.1 AIR carboxylase family protein [Theionarchaea archaeon]MBU7020992.1 AIR carboxylase family protein [Theionarchaea archaeon]MBU7034369.1 AIR carboxylase family protein [Theionarchaea archaeon]MBU7040067.1 AIR carboxylase family protein [Theionarchaea archaeon]